MDNKKDMMEEELKRGWEAATQLRSLIVDVPISQLQTFNQRSLSSSSSDHDDDDHQTLDCMKNYSNTVLHSFQNSISIIKNMIQSMEIQASSSSAQPQTCEFGSPPSKNRRYIIETLNLNTSDGYTWRKYGQKSIYNTTYPREYFKCVYKEDQNCQATKHVQQISDSPTKYRVTYYADHTCQPNLVKNTNISDFHVLDIFENDCTNYMSFESKNPISISKEAINHPKNSLNSTPSCSTTINPPLSPLESLDDMVATMTMTMTTTTTTTMEIFNPELDVVFSPRSFISPNYMDSSNIESTIDYSLMTIEPSFDFDNCALNDFPIWN